MEESTPFIKPPEHSMGKKFSDMTRWQKAAFVGKVIVCVATFGYAFPNVQSD